MHRNERMVRSAHFVYRGPTDEAGSRRRAAKAAYREGASAWFSGLTSVARTAFERAIGLDPEMGAARVELARLESSSSDPARRQRSLDMLRELHRSWPSDRSVLYAMMMAQARALACDDASETFRTWLSVTGLPPDHRVARAIRLRTCIRRIGCANWSATPCVTACPSASPVGSKKSWRVADGSGLRAVAAVHARRQRKQPQIEVRSRMRRERQAKTMHAAVE